MSGGYLDWSPDPGRNAFQEAFTFNGRQITTTGIQPSGSFSGGGVALERFGGEFVYSFTPAHPNKPLHGGLPEALTLEVDAHGVLPDYHHLAQLAKQAMLAPVEIFMRLESSDEWQVDAGRSRWTTSFSMGFKTAIDALFSPPLPAPVVEVRDRAGNVLKVLTVVSGAPAAGEVQIDQTLDTDLMTTFAGDLDGDAGGRLVVEYFPVLTCALEPTSWTRPDLNILLMALELAITPLSKDWKADTP